MSNQNKTYTGTPEEWLNRAIEEVVCDCGQLSPETRRLLERKAKQGVISKWRGYWYPEAGASWGIGPLKTCFGPDYMQFVPTVRPVAPSLQDSNL